MTTETGKPARGGKPRGWAATDVALLILRLGIGGIFILHGWPKVAGGAALWEKLGGAMSFLGVPLGQGQWGFLSDPKLWGAAAAFTEFVGGILLVVGLFVRPMAFLMLFTMFVATWTKVATAGPSIKAWGGPATPGLIFLFLVIAGGGRVALGQAFKPFRRRWFA